jgi:2-methylisocitrate lyase-like PEP mutase family enzyme
MTRCQRLRDLIKRRPGLVVPGAYDAVSARLVEQAGFPVVFRGVREGDTVRPAADRYLPFREFNDLIGVAEQFALAQRYAG